MVEILAPAGGEEQLTAAVRCGADAVYLGAGDFNARQGAENFGGGKLAQAVSFCHVRGVKTHVTLNTLVMDAESQALEDTVREIAASGADAVIVQDLGVNDLLRRRVPGLPRHASTQMTVHNLDGAKLAADLGFSRVVLARELTLREIETIAAGCGIETEVFIHGALCMCMSGQCYLSSMLGGRSGNRGRCAQPCRLNFRNGRREYALSLKDMSHIKHVKELADAGVASFKIEGRLKRPEYVAAAVTAVRAALRGEAWDEESLRAVFSRGGFTDGYLTGRRDTRMFGTREREDVTAAAGVLGRLAALYRTEYPGVPVDMRFTATREGSCLEAVCGGDTVHVAGQVPQKALSRPLDGDSAGKSLSKTGGTPYTVRDFAWDIEPGLMLPASALNAMRREALEELTARRGAVTPHPVLPEPPRAPVPAHVPERTALWGHFRRAEQIPEGARLDVLILPLEEVERRPELVERYGRRLAVEFPPLWFSEKPGEPEERARRVRAMGVETALCQTLYAIGPARRAGLKAVGGAGLNVMNTRSLLALEELGLEAATVSFELGMNRIAALGGSLPRGIVAYGRLPLMRFRACPLRGKEGCGACPGMGTLTDRRGVEFPVVCHRRQFGTLLNSVPLHIGEKALPPLDFLLLSFTLETPEEVKTVIEQYRAHAPSREARTGGLYFRQIL